MGGFRDGAKGKAALARGNAARDACDWTTAAQHYRLHLQAKPGHFAIWVQLGHVLKESGFLADAHAAYGEARRLNPLDADLLLSLGHLHKLMGRREEAIAFYRQSAARDGNTHARDELRHLGEQLDPRGAGALAQASVPAPPTGVSRLFNFGARKSLALANAARDRREWNAAAEHYRRYLLARPNRFAIWVQLGHALKESGRKSEALLVYKEAQQLNPSDADLFLNMGHLYKTMNDSGNAADCYRRSAELDGNPHATAELHRLGVSPSARA